MRELLNLFPRYKFNKIVKKHSGNRYVKYYTSWQQLITLLYSQITNKDSLREIVLSLNAHKNKWYHLGFKGVKRSTLSDSMEKRSYKIFEELFYSLLEKCKRVTPKHKFKFSNPLYSIDSTTIDLCLSIFPWAKFRKRKGAIKLHYLYNHSGCLPSFLTMTDGKKHDITVAKNNDKLNFKLLPGSIISVDKAYIDYEWLNLLDEKGVYFVTRVKNNIDCSEVGQHELIEDDDIEKDVLVTLNGVKSSKKYPKKLRIVGFINSEDDYKYYELPTNNFARSLKHLHIIISSVLMARVNILDILQLTEVTIEKARSPGRQVSIF